MGWGCLKISARSILTQRKSHIPRPFTNKIGFNETSRTVAHFAKEGTMQVVGEGFGQMRKKVIKIRNLQELPHPAYGHLLPHGEGKEAKDCFTLKR